MYRNKENKKGYVISAYVNALRDVLAAMVDIRQNGNLYVSFFKDGEVIYYTNDEELVSSVPVMTIYQWIREGFSDKPIIFKNAKKPTEAIGIYVNEDRTKRFEILPKGDTIEFEASYLSDSMADYAEGFGILDNNFVVGNTEHNEFYLNFCEDNLVVFSKDVSSIGGVFNKISNSPNFNGIEISDSDDVQNQLNGETLQLNNDELTRLNIAISNFVELNFDYSALTTDDELINFAILHNKINYSSRIEYENGYEILDASHVANTIRNLLGRDVELSSTDYSTYRDGKYYTPAADGGYFGRFAQVSEVLDTGNDVYTITYEIYEADIEYELQKGLYEPASTWSNEIRNNVYSTGVIKNAIVKILKTNGRYEYQLLEMK